MRMKRDFLRRDWNKKSRLGGRRKKLKWRKSKGRHSKIRQKWKGYSGEPDVGFKKPRKTRGLVMGKKTIMINVPSDLEKIRENEIGIVSATVGRKKRIEIAEKAVSLKAKLLNLDAEKFIAENKPKETKK